jgi:hypothetical protein
MLVTTAPRRFPLSMTLFVFACAQQSTQQSQQQSCQQQFQQQSQQ